MALAVETLSTRAGFSAALSGDEILHGIVRELAERPAAPLLDWTRIHLFAADDSWDARVCAALRKLPLPRGNLHRPTLFASAPTDAATRYEQVLRAHFQLAPEDLPRFDLVLLEMGSDGRVGGLLPGAAALAETGRMVVSDFTAAQHHLSLTLPVINSAACVVIAVSSAPARASRSTHEAGRAPLRLIAPTNGRLIMLADHDCVVD